MAREGWCQECEKWVWLDAGGACPNGHEADSVSHSFEGHESGSGAAVEAGIGVGPIRPEVMRFNWGAFLVPVIWGAGYGIWSLVALWAISLLVPLTLAEIVAMGRSGAPGSTPVSAVIGVTVISDAVVAYIRLWCGANANRLLWEREGRRLDADPSAKPRVSTRLFMRRQRTWAMGGAIGTVLALAISYPATLSAWAPYGLQSAALAEPLAFLAAQVALGAWLGHRMRAEHPAGPAEAEGVA